MLLFEAWSELLPAPHHSYGGERGLWPNIMIVILQLLTSSWRLMRRWAPVRPGTRRILTPAWGFHCGN